LWHERCLLLVTIVTRSPEDDQAFGSVFWRLRIKGIHIALITVSDTIVIIDTSGRRI
jgi:hypothetical protein